MIIYKKLEILIFKRNFFYLNNMKKMKLWIFILGGGGGIKDSWLLSLGNPQMIKDKIVIIIQYY